MQKNNVKKAFLIVLLVAALYAIPTFVKNAYVLRVCVYVTIYSILACSLNLISGVAGQVSMGHAAFYGIGAYASALVTMRLGVPWPIGVLAPGCWPRRSASCWPSPRFDFRAAIWSSARSASTSWFDWCCSTGFPSPRGPMGITNIPRPVLFGVTIKSGSQYLYLSLTMFLIVYLLLNHILRSKFGRNLRAIKEDETAAEALGINVHKEKVQAFSLAAGLGRRGRFDAGALHGLHFSVAVCRRFLDYDFEHGRAGRHGQHAGQRDCGDAADCYS